jgi:hypothetical protein
MGTYVTEWGYIVKETLAGLEVTEDGKEICTLDGKTLDSYRDENDDIIDDMLEADIKEAEETEEFLAYQKEYC